MSERNRRSFKVNALKIIANSSLKKEVPEFAVGDTVKVHVRIQEGDKSRIQVFEGTVIAKKHGGVSETFTVRRIAHGCAVERVFPLHSPVVEKVDVVRLAKVRRAKLYYLRSRVGKAAKTKDAIK
jgi:large subunit ribosomal protein L19